MTENLMDKLTAEDTALLVKLSQVRGDDNPGETIEDLINGLYSDLVWVGWLKRDNSLTTEQRLKEIADHYNLSEADQFRSVLIDACDFEGVSL